MTDDKWILMGTEIVKESPNRLTGVFLNEITSKVKRIELVGTAPYLYTFFDEESLKRMPEIKHNFMRKDGKRWKDNILGFENVKRRHPITQEMTELTKIYAKSSWDLYNPRQQSGLADMLPDKMVFNKNHKFHDYFLNEYGMIMGMSYRITDTGFAMVEATPTEEVMKIVDDMEIPEFLDYALVKKLLPLFFTPFPDLSEQILAMDIEVDNDYKRAINPFEAKYPISSISLYSKHFQMVYVLSDDVRQKNYAYTLPKKINITICHSEADLIKKVLRHLTQTMKEKGVVTFNGDKFDMPYLMCRAHLLNVHEFDRDIWGRWDVQRQTVIKGIKGKFLIDLLPFFANPSIKTYSFPNKYTRNSLKEITAGLLGESKYEFEGHINQLCAEELAYYNHIDTVRTFDLCTFEENIVFNLIFMFMRISGRTFEDVHRRKISAVLTGLINTTLFNSQTVQPNKTLLEELGEIKSEAMIEGKKFKGAKVFNPHELESIGFWTDEGNDNAVTCVDFASLYPSEIKQRNLCFSTVNCEHEECKENIMPNLPHHVCTKRDGILATLIGFIRDIRVKYFKKYKDDSIFSIVEQTLKVLINAGYGVMGSDKFQYFTAPIAEGTTAYGRHDINKVKELCDEHNVKILAGDTDSLFLYKAPREFLTMLFTWVQKELNLEMSVDYSGKYMLVHEMKNYIIDNEGEIIIKGMTGKKSNTPIYVRNCFSDVIEIIKEHNYSQVIMKEKIGETVMEYAKNLDLRHFNPMDMKITIKLGRDLYDYKVEGRQVKAAKKLVKYLREKINDKSIPDYVIVPKDTYIDFVIERGNKKQREPTPIEMLEDNKGIDVKYYKESLVKTLAQVLKPLSIPLDQFLIDHNQQSVEDWFI